MAEGSQLRRALEPGGESGPQTDLEGGEMTDKLDLEAIQQCLREWLEHADTTPRDHSLVFNLLTIDLPALVAEVERLRARVKELENLTADYAEQTADARRMSTKLDRIAEVMDE